MPASGFVSSMTAKPWSISSRAPQFRGLATKMPGRARLWTCREEVWETTFRGKKVDGKSFPDNRFGAVFFQPFYAGQTFGLGQLNPLTALVHT
jgi:hypothetical protein